MTAEDSSAGWRDEYDHQGVQDDGDPDDPRTDGGGRGKYDLPEEGDRVEDIDADEESELVVIDVQPEVAAAGAWVDTMKATVAGLNPDHPADAPVVEAVYVEQLERSTLDWRGDTTEALRLKIHRTGLTIYSFPSTRLRPVDDREVTA